MIDSKDWIKKGREKAPELRESARSAAANMFASGDLSSFLDVLSHLPCYDACNLMLILLQYPKATCLAGYRVWERLIADPRAAIIKPEWRGKAIDLIAPFTEQRDKRDLRLTWFAVGQFDIAQTNATYSLPPSVYVMDGDHMSMLIEGACRALRREYHLTVHHAPTEAGMSNAALPGVLTDKIVYMYDEAKPAAKLAWLVDSLCTLHGGPVSLPPGCHDIFFVCIRNTLWRTWGLDMPPSLAPYRTRIRNMSDDIQMDFLDLLQRSYRFIEESIAAGYAEVREEARQEQEAAQGIRELDATVLLEDLRPSPYG